MPPCAAPEDAKDSHNIDEKPLNNGFLGTKSRIVPRKREACNEIQSCPGPLENYLSDEGLQREQGTLRYILYSNHTFYGNFNSCLDFIRFSFTNKILIQKININLQIAGRTIHRLARCRFS